MNRNHNSGHTFTSLLIEAGTWLILALSLMLYLYFIDSQFMIFWTESYPSYPLTEQVFREEIRPIWIAIIGMILTATVVALPLTTFMVERFDREYFPWEKEFLLTKINLERKAQFVLVSMFVSTLTLVFFPSYLGYISALFLLLVSVVLLLGSYLTAYLLFSDKEKIRVGGESTFIAKQESYEDQIADSVRMAERFRSNLANRFEEFSGRGFSIYSELYSRLPSTNFRETIVPKNYEIFSFDSKVVGATVNWFTKEFSKLIPSEFPKSELRFDNIHDESVPIFERDFFEIGIFGTAVPHELLGIHLTLKASEFSDVDVDGIEDPQQLFRQLGDRLRSAIVLKPEEKTEYSFDYFLTFLDQSIQQSLREKDRVQFEYLLELLIAIYQSQFSPERESSGKRVLSVSGVWKEVLLSMKDFSPPHSFLSATVSKLFDFASVSLKARSMQDFKWLNQLLPTLAQFKGFDSEWPDFRSYLALLWRDFAFVNFREKSDDLFPYFLTYLYPYQAIVTDSLDDEDTANEAIESTHYLDHLEVHFRDWGAKYLDALAFPFIGIEIVVISHLNQEQISSDFFRQIFWKLLDRQILINRPHAYAKALEDDISSQFGWDFIDLSFTPRQTAAYIDVRGKILFSLTLRLALRKIGHGWEDSLTQHDLSKMQQTLESGRFLEVVKILKDDFTENDQEVIYKSIAEVMRQKENEIESKIKDSVMDQELVTSFFDEAEKEVTSYRDSLVNRFRMLGDGLGEHPDYSVRVNVNKRFFLHPIDRSYYHLDADIYFRSIGEIETYTLVKRLLDEANQPGYLETFTGLEAAIHYLTDYWGANPPSSMVCISINMDFSERKAFEVKSNECSRNGSPPELFDYWDSKFPKGCLIIETPELFGWVQNKLTAATEVNSRIIDDGRFSIELHEDQTNKENVVLILRQNFCIRLLDSCVIRFLKIETNEEG